MRGHLCHLLSSRRHLHAARARTTLPPAHISSSADGHPLDDSISLHKRAGWLSSIFACPCHVILHPRDKRCPPPTARATTTLPSALVALSTAHRPHNNIAAACPCPVVCRLFDGIAAACSCRIVRRPPPCNNNAATWSRRFVRHLPPATRTKF